MMLASTMAGMAMNPTRLGLAHALAMPLGSWDLKIPHSIAIAVTLPVVMEFNCTAAPERFVAVARALGEPVDGCSTLEGAARAALSVRRLARDIGIPNGLSGYRSRGAPRPRGRRGSDEERKRRGQSAAHDQGAARRHSAMCAAEIVTAPGQERSIEGPVTNRITQDMPQHMNVIGGVRMAASGGAYYSIRNPARPAECLGEFANSTPADADAALGAAEAAALAWAATPGPQRGALLFRFADLLEASKDELARIITLEQGKALGESMGEVGRAAAEARFMAGEASRPMGLSFPSERPGIILLHGRRAARHRRDHLPLELPCGHARPQDCARARLGQTVLSSSRRRSRHGLPST